MLDKLKLGSAVRIARELRSLSQKDLYKLSQVPQPTISRIETGARMPGADILLALAEAMKTTPDDIYALAGALDGIIHESGPAYITNVNIARLLDIATQVKTDELCLICDIAESIMERYKKEEE